MSELNQVIHQPIRLRIMAVLVELGLEDEIDFVYLRNLLEVTDGNLGAHLAKLEGAKYLRIRKAFVDRKPRTYIAVTGGGQDAFRGHCAALKAILKGSS